MVRIFALFLLFNVHVLANSSVEITELIRLDSPGFSMEQVPVVDQGPYGICYACTMSSAADAWKCSMCPPITFDERGSDTVEAPEQPMPLTPIAIAMKVEEVKPDEDLSEAFKSTVDLNADGWARYTRGGSDRYVLSLKAIKSAEERMGEEVDLHRIPNEGVQETEEAFLQHFERVTSRTQPLIMSYCANILSEGRKYKGVSWKDLKYIIMRKNCGVHSGLVTGKRKKNDRLQFLIHNSWGEDCSKYSKEWRKDCEGGKVWIDSSTLMDNVVDVFVLTVVL